MQTGGWKTKNWSDFTCYTSDGKSALAMEPITDDIHRWSIYNAGPDGGWLLGIHNMEHGVFCARSDGRQFESDIESMELQGDTLQCRGHLRDGDKIIADCEAGIRRSRVDDQEVFSITYRYQFQEPGPYEVFQQYDSPLGSTLTPQLFLPAEGCTLTWNQEYASMRATLTLDQPVEKSAEFQIAFYIGPGS